jgi:hypothetical protein
MAKLWPSRNSTVVRARRVVRAGIVVPEIVTALAKSSALTSGTSFKLMTPRDRTVGVKLSFQIAVDNEPAWRFVMKQTVFCLFAVLTVATQTASAQSATEHLPVTDAEKIGSALRPHQSS